MAAAATASSLCYSEASMLGSQSLPNSESALGRRPGGAFGGMFKVPSLVFDIELEDNGIGAGWCQEDEWEEEEVILEIQRFVQPTCREEARLLSDVRVACPHAKDGQDTARLVSILAALGYRCSLRTVTGGGDGADCLRNLRHTFISCDTPAVNGAPARHFIVDPMFRDQFIVAKNTPRYAGILAAVPQVFVGPEEHLQLLVQFLCTEMSAAFRQLGSVLPPWRHASSMLSKWKPRKSVDESTAGYVRAGSGMVGANTGTGFPGMDITIAEAVVAPQLQWSCRPTPAPLQPHNHQLHLWQQVAAQNPHQQLATAMTPAMTPEDRRRSFEPQRVVFGGNFVPIPTPAPAS